METEYSYRNCGKSAINLKSNKNCIVIKENLATGQVMTLENICPVIVNTHDNWDTLLLLDAY